MHFSRRSGAPRRGHATVVRSASAIALTITTSVTGLALATAPASAAAPLACTDTLYVADSSTGDIRPLNPATGAVGPAAYDGTPSGGTGNQVGVGPGGAYAINTDGTNIIEYDAAGGTTATPVAKVGGSGTVAGAIDPDSGLFYYGGYVGNNLAVHVYDPATNTTSGPVANVTVPAAPGTNGDLAFDADGTLYFVAASATETALYTLRADLPSTAQTPVAGFTATELTRTTGLPAASNGIAFASDGYLYLGRSTEFTKVNPIDGTTVGVATGLAGGVTSTDLASCAGPSTLTLTVDLPSGRVNPTDQFEITAGGGSYDGTPAFPVGTTTGTESGPQTGPGEQAGKAIVLPGETYTTTLTPAPGTDPADYLIGWRCVDTGTGLETDAGTGSSFVIDPDSSSTNACSFVVTNPLPAITLDKSVSPTSFDDLGDELTYTFAVENTGNVELTAFDLDDTMPGLSTPVCAPVAVGGTLAVGATTTCTATYEVSQADVDAGVDKSNSASVTGTPTKGTVPTDSDSATSAYAVVGPDADNDSLGTPYDTAVTLPARTDDTAGSSPIVTASTVFTSPSATNGGKDLDTVEGTWQVNANGTVTFTPVDGYVGTTAPVEYSVTDENGLADTADLTVTVRTGPTAVANTATTKQNVNVDVSPLGNDTAGPQGNGTAGTFDNSSLALVLTAGLPAGSTVTPDGRTMTVLGEGVYTVDPATGVVRFNPATSFTDVATPITYTAVDHAGNPVTSTITITVTPIDPTANDDAAKTPFGAPVTLDVLDNDVEGDASAPLDESSVVLTDADATNGGKTLVTSEGTWQVDTDGSITFTPVAGFTGTTPAVEYAVGDANGETDTATMTVVVGRAPLAAPDLGSTPQGTDVTVDPLDNDIAGDRGEPCTAPSTPVGCDTGTFDATSVVFGPAGQPSGSSVSGAGRTLTVPGEGVYTINAVTGEITFDPEAGFSGQASPVTYTVTDSYDNDASATATITVRPIGPLATDDSRNTTYGAPVRLPATTNDTPGTDDHGTPGDPSDDVTPAVVPGATVFPSAGQPAGAVLSHGGTTLTVPGQGTWEVQPDGAVVFTPADGYTGTTSAVTYAIEDVNGSTDTATLVVTVRAGVRSLPDTATTPQDVNVTLNPLGNDTPAVAADGAPATWVASSVKLALTPGLPVGSTVSADGRTVTLPGQGVLTVGPNGAVTFDPEPRFTGTAGTIRYEVTDSLGNTSSSTVTFTVTPITPVATGDSVRTPYSTPVVIGVLANDTAGTGAPLVPGSLRLIDPTTGLAVVQVVVPGQGTWTVVDGSVRFEPADGFSGQVTPIRYSVADVNGTTTEAAIEVYVEAPGVAGPTEVQTSVGDPVTVDVLDNVTPAEGEVLLEDTLCLLPGSVQVDGKDVGKDGSKDVGKGHKLAKCVQEYTEPGVGTWEVNPDGTITFTPAAGFSGAATIGFQVEDSAGNTYQDELDVTVGGESAKGAEPSDGERTAGLPDTGGPGLGWVFGGLASVLAGLVVLRRRGEPTA